MAQPTTTDRPPRQLSFRTDEQLAAELDIVARDLRRHVQGLADEAATRGRLLAACADLIEQVRAHLVPGTQAA